MDTETCEVCDNDVHRMDTLSASYFGYNRVCLSCVTEFLDTGVWPHPFEEWIDDVIEDYDSGIVLVNRETKKVIAHAPDGHAMIEATEEIDYDPDSTLMVRPADRHSKDHAK